MSFINYLEENMIVPDIAKLYSIFSRIKNNIIDKSPPKKSMLTGKYTFRHSPKSLISILNKAFKKDKICFEYNKNAEQHKLGDGESKEMFRAFLYPRYRYIEVEIGPLALYQMMDPKEYDHIVSILINMIGHEQVHLEQLNRRLKEIGIDNIKSSTEDVKAYLSDPMEIQSYAWQIWNDMDLVGYNCNDMVKLLKKPKELAEFSTIFNVYYEIFKSSSPAMKNLIKRIYQYINLK
jgi:hypothetical protein